MNLIQWLNSYIASNVQISDKMKSMLSANQYFSMLAEKEYKFIKTSNWCFLLTEDAFPLELYVLSQDQKGEIAKFLEDASLDVYVHYMHACFL